MILIFLQKSPEYEATVPKIAKMFSIDNKRVIQEFISILLNETLTKVNESLFSVYCRSIESSTHHHHNHTTVSKYRKALKHSAFH